MVISSNSTPIPSQHLVVVSDMPTREELDDLLRCFPTFTNIKSYMSSDPSWHSK